MNFIKRLFAFIIDVFIISISLIVFTLLLSIYVNKYNILIRNFELLISITYLTLLIFKDVPFKRSIGKIIMKIKIYYSDSEKKVSIFSLILRNITIIIYPIEVLCYLFVFKTRNKLGDILAKTRVTIM